MATKTQTPAETPVTCDYCLGTIDGGTVRHITVHGVALDLCGVDVAYIARRPVHARARILLRLARLYGAAQGEDDGEDGDDDGGPAPAPAAPSARPLSLALVAAGAGPAWVELSPAEEAELDAFEQAVAETWDPVPCDQCGKAAAPAVLTDEGRTLCLACGEGPDAPPSARSAVRDVRFSQTARRLACARLSRELAGVVGAGAAVR